MSKKNITGESSFTFIELLAALIVLAVGVLSVIAVSAKSYYAISLQKNKLIATNLAREGIELVKNVRNKNWLWKGDSYCDVNEGTANSSSFCSNGRVEENDSDCDWRCGSRDVSPSDNKFFRLQQSWPYNGKTYFFKNLDYNLYNLGVSKEEILPGNEVPSNPTCENDGVYLNTDSNGFYANSSQGDFKRLILINRDIDENGDGNPNNDLQVIVSVCWKEMGGVWEQVSVEEHLFNWYKPE